MAMTIVDVKKAAIELETAITKLMQDFEKETGMRTGYMDIMRKRDASEDSNSPESIMPREEPTKDIETVNIDIRFED